MAQETVIIGYCIMDIATQQPPATVSPVLVPLAHCLGPRRTRLNAHIHLCSVLLAQHPLKLLVHEAMVARFVIAVFATLLVVATTSRDDVAMLQQSRKAALM